MTPAGTAAERDPRAAAAPRADAVRVLLIDDERSAYMAVDALLMAVDFGGYAVEWAPTLRDGAALLEERRHDVCLLDYRLPDGDALEFLRALRQGGPTVPVILLTGMDSRTLAVEAMKAGAADYLVKGQFKVPELERSLRYALERHRSESALRSSEERCARLLEVAHEGAWLLDPDLRVSYVNPRVTEMLGYAAEEMLDHSVYEFMFPEDHAAYETLAQRRRGGIAEQYDFRLRTKAGAELWVLVSAAPYPDSSGHFAGILGLFTDLTARKQAEDALRTSAERLQVLSQRLIQAQEDERRRIAHELHDELGQSLTALKINLQGSLRAGDPEAARARVNDSLGLVEQMLQQVRSLSLDLRPSLLDDLGLVPALEWYLSKQAERAGLAVEFEAAGVAVRPAWEVETACFRIAQEALTNVIRHAGARQVRVAVRCEAARLHLVFEDDGCGFDVADARSTHVRGQHLGLLGMEERALLVGGSFTVTSRPRRGTRITADFPLAAAAPGGEAAPLPA